MHQSTEHKGAGHETSDVEPRFVGWFAVGMLALTVVAIVLMRVMFSGLADYQTRSDKPVPPLAPTLSQLPPAPRLQETPIPDLVRTRERERGMLESPPSWVERRAGVVRIPIERAMERLLERGLPVRQAGQRPGKTPAKEQKR